MHETEVSATRCERGNFRERRSCPNRPEALSITGQNSKRTASVVIEPTRPFDQNTAGTNHCEAEGVFGAAAEH
jgi:hypothetical protein